MNNQKPENQYFLKCNKELRAISFDEITHITCDGYICNFYSEEEKIIATQTKLLKEYETELVKYGFIRVNRSTLINTNKIKTIDLQNRKVILANDSEISISFRKLSSFRQFFKN